MERTRWAFVLATGVVLCTLLPRPVLAQPPILQASSATGYLLPCLASTSGAIEEFGGPWEYTTPDGQYFPATFQRDRDCTEYEFNETLGKFLFSSQAVWSVGVDEIGPSGEEQEGGPVPSVKVSGYSISGLVYRNVSAQATLDYYFGIDIKFDALPDIPDDELSQLIDELEMIDVPVAVFARAEASTTAPNDPLAAQILHARAAVTILGNFGTVFELEARQNPVTPEQNTAESVEKSDIVDFPIGGFNLIKLLAGGQAQPGRTDTNIAFYAKADPHFEIDVEALQTRLLDMGINYPNPEQFYQLRFSPDVEQGWRHLSRNPLARRSLWQASWGYSGSGVGG